VCTPRETTTFQRGKNFEEPSTIPDEGNLARKATTPSEPYPPRTMRMKVGKNFSMTLQHRDAGNQPLTEMNQNERSFVAPPMNLDEGSLVQKETHLIEKMTVLTQTPQISLHRIGKMYCPSDQHRTSTAATQSGQMTSATRRTRGR